MQIKIRLKYVVKFIYLGGMAWIFSIAVQTPLAFTYWGMSPEQYIRWVIAGVPVTLLFFGGVFRSRTLPYKGKA